MASRDLKSMILLTLAFMLFFGIYSAWNPSPVRSQDPSPQLRPDPSPVDHASMDMPMDHAHMHGSAREPLTPDQQAKLLRDKKESEFNHHLAGFLVVLAGIFILFEERLKRRFPRVRYAWPLCFLLAGILLLIFSDTELWPFGYKDWWTGVTGNVEVLQHKSFAVILMILGVVEIRRAKGTLQASWSAWAFPALAFAGSFLLLFHSHDAGMAGPDPMTEMRRIQMQHFSYAGVGAAIGLSKGLSDTSTKARSVFRRLWPLLMISLGILLMLYTE
jgi:putative copper resistance protein D